MRSAVIFYHNNIGRIYKRRWIDRCVGSVMSQTHRDFDVWELNYGEDPGSYAATDDRPYHIRNVRMPNHIHAMNYLLDMLFDDEGYDVVFNTNMDDYFHPTRFEKQIAAVEAGHDLVSSDFCYVEERGDEDVVTLHMDICRHGDIGENLMKKHNVIAHPCVAFTRGFWGGDLRYRDLLGWEDLELWMRGHQAGKSFHIVPEELLFYRIHPKQVTKEHKSGA